MAEKIVELLQDYLTPQLIVFVISMMPVLELRGGLFAASLLGIPWQQAAVICIVGTMLPVPVILMFVRHVLLFMQKHGPFRKLADHFVTKATTKGAEIAAKYPRTLPLALFLFVAIPLPGTGAWTGSLIAAFLGLRIRQSAPPICLGALGAALIMLTLTYLIPSLMGIK